MRYALRPLSRPARLRRLEAEPRPYESAAERASREVLTRWLAQSEDGVELWLDYLEAMEAAGGQVAMLSHSDGRAAIEAVVIGIYDLNMCAGGLES